MAEQPPQARRLSSTQDYPRSRGGLPTGSSAIHARQGRPATKADGRLTMIGQSGGSARREAPAGRRSAGDEQQRRIRSRPCEAKRGTHRFTAADQAIELALHAAGMAGDRPVDFTRRRRGRPRHRHHHRRRHHHACRPGVGPAGQRKPGQRRQDALARQAAGGAESVDHSISRIGADRGTRRRATCPVDCPIATRPTLCGMPPTDSSPGAGPKHAAVYVSLHRGRSARRSMSRSFVCSRASPTTATRSTRPACMATWMDP